MTCYQSKILMTFVTGLAADRLIHYEHIPIRFWLVQVCNWKEGVFMCGSNGNKPKGNKMNLPEWFCKLLCCGNTLILFLTWSILDIGDILNWLMYIWRKYTGNHSKESLTDSEQINRQTPSENFPNPEPNDQQSFLNKLFEEKLKHKEHRFSFVGKKAAFVVVLLGLGSIDNFGLLIDSTSTTPKADLETLLYLVPFVALVYDVFILSEDLKIKRIGAFLRNRQENGNSVCTAEICWEEFVRRHREPMAATASKFLTIMTFGAAFLALSISKQTVWQWRVWMSLKQGYLPWAFLFWFIGVLVYYKYESVRESLRSAEEKSTNSEQGALTIEPSADQENRKLSQDVTQTDVTKANVQATDDAVLNQNDSK